MPEVLRQSGLETGPRTPTVGALQDGAEVARRVARRTGELDCGQALGLRRGRAPLRARRFQ